MPRLTRARERENCEVRGVAKNKCEWAHEMAMSRKLAHCEQCEDAVGALTSAQSKFYYFRALDVGK